MLGHFHGIPTGQLFPLINWQTDHETHHLWVRQRAIFVNYKHNPRNVETVNSLLWCSQVFCQTLVGIFGTEISNFVLKGEFMVILVHTNPMQRM